METPESIRSSLIPGEWVSLIDLSEAYLHLPSFRTGHSPTGLYNDCKGSEADGPHKGNQASPVPGRLADQGPISGRSSSEHSDNGRPDLVLRVDNKSEEI